MLPEETYLEWRKRVLDDAGFTRALVEDETRFKGTVKEFFDESAKLVEGV